MRTLSVLLRAAALAVVAPSAALLAPLLAQSTGAAVAGPAADFLSGLTPAEALLGLSAAASGTGRDTLGLLVVAVAPNGPADRAGISEGSRLAEINGVSLRLAPATLGDRSGAAAVAQRFEQQLRAVRPGDGVVLRLAGAGTGRTVTVTTAGPPRPTPSPAAPVATVAEPPAPPAAPPDAPPALAAPAAAPASPAPANRESATPAPPTVPGPNAAAAPASLAAVILAMGEIQTQLHRLARDEPSAALADTLGRVEDELAALRRRLRGAQPQPVPVQPAPTQPVPASPAPAAAPAVPAPTAAPPVAPTTSPATAPPPATAPAETERSRIRVQDSGDDGWADAALGITPGLRGIRLTPVSAELSRALGEGTAGGLLVLQADPTWDPIQAGDVLVRIDGAAADATRLRASVRGRVRSRIDFLRRGRAITVTLPEEAGTPVR